jgi:two-component sensor histidine kinase
MQVPIMFKVLRITLGVLTFNLGLQALATDENDLAARCTAQIEEGRALMSQDPVKALAIARNAVNLAVSAGDERLELQALRMLAQVELHLDMVPEFLQTTLEAMEAAGAVGDPRQLSMVLRDLSTAYQLNLRSDLAVDEAKRALAVITPLNDTEELASAQLFLTRALIAAGDLSGAFTLTDHLNRTCASATNELCQARADHATAQVLIAQKKFHDALPYLTKAGRIIGELGDPSEQFDVTLDRLRLLINIGLLRETSTGLDLATAILKQLGDEKRGQELLELKYQYAVASQRWQDAVILLQRLRTHDDSLKTARVHLNMAGMQVAHQLESKESDNITLRQMNAEQKEQILDQRASNHYLIVALGIMAMLAAALFLMHRKAIRLSRRLRRKAEVIKRQHAEIEARVLELQRKNVRLAECIVSEEGKELILKEIHHRVKNNLQVVESMITMQMGGIADDRVQRLLKDAQGRIRSMAMVHEHIYRSNGTNEMPLKAHLEKLGRNVLVAHGAHDRISIMVDSPLQSFPVETLLPFSLLVNELLTNSIKHAFRESDHGGIRMSVKEHEKGFEFRYSDDGTGMVPDTTGSVSFGQELVGILAQQLNGEVKWLRGAGVVFSLTFLPDKDILKMAS